MRRGSTHRPGRSLTAAALIAGAALAVLAAPVAAALRANTIVANPLTLTQGTTKTVDLTVTNVGSGGGGEEIGCVTVQVPGAFDTLDASIASLPAGYTWKASISGASGSSVLVKFQSEKGRLVGGAKQEQAVFQVRVTPDRDGHQDLGHDRLQRQELQRRAVSGGPPGLRDRPGRDPDAASHARPDARPNTEAHPEADAASHARLPRPIRHPARQRRPAHPATDRSADREAHPGVDAGSDATTHAGVDRRTQAHRDAQRQSDDRPTGHVRAGCHADAQSAADWLVRRHRPDRGRSSSGVPAGGGQQPGRSGGPGGSAGPIRYAVGPADDAPVDLALAASGSTLGLTWIVPSLTLAVPGLLLVLVVVIQATAGFVWVPVVRRRIGSFGLRGPRR